MNIFRSTYIQLLMLSILIPSIRTATFKYNPGSQTDIKSQGDASFMNDGIQLTTIGASNSTGRAVYAKPVRLWDSATGGVANFSTRFSFLIEVEKGKEDSRGDGLAFFLAPNEMENESSSKKGVTKKFGGKNCMWSNRKDQFLLTFLAECARNGGKHGKSFKGFVFEKAAKAVSDKFDELCTSTNVDSRMKTVRKKYKHIKTLRERSGWTWNEELKMIKVDKTEALAFIEDNPYAKDLLNVPIEQYEERKLVCGDDQAIGCYGKSTCDAEYTCESRETSETPSTTSSSMQGSGRHKRSRNWGEKALSKIDGLTAQISLLAETVSTVDQDFCDRVYAEVMKLEGYDDRVLDKAFEYLTNNPVAGRQFLSKHLNMRMLWMEDFASQKD